MSEYKTKAKGWQGENFSPGLCTFLAEQLIWSQDFACVVTMPDDLLPLNIVINKANIISIATISDVGFETR